MNLCVVARGCPASLYMSCRGFKDGLNCWEIDAKPCCRDNDLSICLGCAVYTKCKPVRKVGEDKRLWHGEPT